MNIRHWIGRGIEHWQRLSRLIVLLGLGLGLLLTSCAIPRVSAEQRLFLDLSVDFLGEAILPAQGFEETVVGGLSAIVYDPHRDRIYALSDDRSRLAPARFYTLAADLSATGIQSLSIEGVTFLKDEAGNFYGAGQIDPEGLALTATDSVIISSEGSVQAGVPPFIGEFDRGTGQLRRSFPIPQRYLADSATAQTQGIQENLGFEALTLNTPAGAMGYTEPFRLFVATEGPLLQDLDANPDIPFKNRLLHYLIDQNQATVLSEHWYPMDLSPSGAISNGLSELLTLDTGGHFLALERAFGLQGMTVKLYQIATGGASDVGAIATLQGDTLGLAPIRKQLVADLTAVAVTQNFTLDNLEGMTLGPRLADGSQSLILVSDDNFNPEQQKTQFLLFRLKQ